MPLSEEELRLLEQMERALVAEDPKFASTLRGTRMRRNARRRMILGILAFFAGIALLMSGAVLSQIALGVVGFLVMLGSAYLTLMTWRNQNRAPVATEQDVRTGQPLRVVEGGRARRGRSSSSSRSPRQGTMMQRFEERWRRRREQNGM